MTPLRCAVVGVGYLGRFHAQKYKALEAGGLCKLVAVCDQSTARAEEVGNELKVPFLREFQKLAEQVDAVSIAADTSVHYEVAKYFLEHGVHVLVEKPITANSGDAQVLLDLAEKKKLVLQVGHIERFSPAWTEAQKLIDKPILADFQRLAPFGPRSNSRVDVIIDLMVHDLDLLLSIDRSPVKVVKSVARSLVTPLNDVATANLKFESGLEAQVTASRIAPFVFRRAHIVQKSGSIQIDMGQLTVSGALYKAGAVEVINQTVEKADALLLEVESFLKSIHEKASPRVTGMAGFKALQLAELVLEKARSE